MTAPKIQALDHLVLTVRDLDATLRFYCDALGMRHVTFFPADGSSRHALGFGAQKINLHVAGAEFDPKAQSPTPGSADLCFLVAGRPEEWADRLARHDIPIEEGPVNRSGAQFPIRSLYIRDPDGNLIELSVPA